MPPQGGQCPYCQLIQNPDQLLTVGETENFYAWLEINPRAKGHTQIVPKEHVESITDLEFSEYQEAMKLVRMVMAKAEDGIGADGVSVTMNVKEAGGQMLPHAYISVFPRFEEEENAGTPTGAIFPQREELQQQLQDIQESMASISPGFEESHEAHPEAERFKERTVDREELERKAEEESSEEKESREPDQKTEPESSTQEREPERKKSKNNQDKNNEEDDEELERTGHWDGKSFEWR